MKKIMFHLLILMVFLLMGCISEEIKLVPNDQEYKEKYRSTENEEKNDMQAAVPAFCNDKTDYSKYMILETDDIAFIKEYTEPKAKEWQQFVKENYIGDLKADYNIKCEQLSEKDCDVFSNPEKYGVYYKTNPKLDCANLTKTYLCEEEKVALDEEKIVILDPYFNDGEQQFYLIVQVIDDGFFIKNTVCGSTFST